MLTTHILVHYFHMMSEVELLSKLNMFTLNFSLHLPEFGEEWGGLCYGRSSFAATNEDEENVVSGVKIPAAPSELNASFVLCHVNSILNLNFSEI